VSADAPIARIELVQRTRVEQAIDRDRFGEFAKEILRAQTPAGRALALVRKYRDDLPRRGAVLLIHGFAQNRYTWHLSTRSFVNYLADSGLDVYNLELTGHGRSREFGTAPAGTFDEYIDDAAAVIRAVAVWSGIPRVFVLGHSLGGAVCYAVAPRIQEQLAGIITIAGIFRFGSNPVTRRIAEFLQVLKRVEPLRRLRAGVLSRGIGKVIAGRVDVADDLSWTFPMAGWVPGSTEPEVLRERLERGFDWTGVGVFLTMMSWAAEGRFTDASGRSYDDEFAELTLPLLVIAGDRDRLLPPADARPAYDLSKSPDKTYKLFSPVREEVHWGHLDIVLGKHAPRYVWPYIEEWILDRCS
jgi:alpha-beta hydrolase superfamily lysophospholipase